MQPHPHLFCEQFNFKKPYKMKLIQNQSSFKTNSHSFNLKLNSLYSSTTIDIEEKPALEPNSSHK